MFSRALLHLMTAAVLLGVPDGAGAQTASKYWLVFTDKPRDARAHAAVITERARERRSRRGTSSAAWLDQPVSARYVDRIRELGAQPVMTSRWLNAVSVRLTRDEVARMRRLSFVREIRPVAHALPPPPSPASRSETAPAGKRGMIDFGPSASQLAAVNALELLESGVEGSGVLLGFLDTPFGEFEHEVFRRLRDESRLLGVRDFVGRPQEEQIHGLSVASVAAGYAEGQLIGPAHGADIVAAITEYVPTETNQEEDYFVAGLEWLEAQGVDVVNVSLGYTTFDAGQRSYAPEDLDGDTGITTQAADRAAALGVVVVASAGNSACPSPDLCWYYVGMPADGDSVITVGAVRPDSTRSGFSSFGPTFDGRIKPDVSAPGSDVYAAVPGGYARVGGTSFSSPIVAGVVCQMLQINPDLKPMDVLRILRETASQSENPDNVVGWGIVNAGEAVRAASDVAVEPSPPTKRISAHAYPNPATDFVFIHINAGGTTEVNVSVYDVVGRRVYRSFANPVPHGAAAVRVPTRALSSGVFAYRVLQQSETTTGTFIVAR